MRVGIYIFLFLLTGIMFIRFRGERTSQQPKQEDHDEQGEKIK